MYDYDSAMLMAFLSLVLSTLDTWMVQSPEHLFVITLRSLYPPIVSGLRGILEHDEPSSLMIEIPPKRTSGALFLYCMVYRAEEI